MQIHLTPISSNKKTGPIPVSTTSAESCPPSCPFKNMGCYGESGPIRLHWDKVSKGERGIEWGNFLKSIKRLHRKQLWRHNQVGDLAGKGEVIDFVKLKELTAANKGKSGFTYTHKHGSLANLSAIREANDAGFTINLSGNNLAHADKLADSQAGPVVTVLPIAQMTNTVTPKGRKVVICPAVNRENVSCATCKLCQKADRSIIIGFPAHGTSKKKVNGIAEIA